MVLDYFKENMIKYHDDGEMGLGPTIATLNLGHSAMITIRMKQKYFQGCTKEVTLSIENHSPVATRRQNFVLHEKSLRSLVRTLLHVKRESRLRQKS